MKPYLGPAGRPDYQRNLYRANMQGADYAGFIGYLLGELQELSARVTEAEAKLAVLSRGELPTQASLEPIKPTPIAVSTVVAPMPLPAPVAAPEPQRPAKPVEPQFKIEPRHYADLDDDALRHIVVEVEEPQPTKKRGK